VSNIQKKSVMTHKFLIIYGTKEGQTAKIADRIGEVVRERGYLADINNARHIRGKISFEEYKGVLIGSSVHAGFWSKAVKHFIRKYNSQLNNVPSAFFSVSLTDATGTAEQRSLLESNIEKLCNKSGWPPKAVGRFAGALAYTRYGCCTRWMMKQAAKSQGESTDTSRDIEYTDWDEVTKFANDFINQCVEGDSSPSGR
jgi:menaquinone-dependent protoporphyrinogen oxidase